MSEHADENAAKPVRREVDATAGTPDEQVRTELDTSSGKRTELDVSGKED